MKTILKPIAILIIMMFIISGCSSKPTHLELVIQSSKDLNPDLDNVSSPLMLTFYELDSAEKFIKYDFWKLLDKSGKKLGDDLISQSKQVITPQQEQVYKIVFDKRTRFLGVIGKFRNIENKAAWKYVINLEKEKYNYTELKIKNFNIERAE
jgi:type VI secretion system protein VasD